MENVVLTTGATSGIGLATAVEMAKRGWCSVGSARSDAKAELLRQAAAEAGVEVDTVLFDVADAAACERAITEVVARHGRLDGLVNNAGYSATGAIEEVSDDEARRLHLGGKRVDASASFGFSRSVRRDVQTRTVGKNLRGGGELNSAKRSSRKKSRAARTDCGSTTRQRRCEMHGGAHANRALDRIGDHDFDSGGPRQSRNFDASSRASEPRCLQDEVVDGIVIDKRAERRGAAE
jgi:NAD(P)-dependent dehydrogenase (short-subunit alcohol dehydrogenase family)